MARFDEVTGRYVYLPIDGIEHLATLFHPAAMR